jgi:4-diphosphocytidyl-2-C-methyl-D-erythritol kinase
LWKLKLSQKELAGIGSKLGADVNLFLYPASMAFGTAKGDRLKAVRPASRLWHVLLTPKNRLKTSQIYGIWDRIAGASTRPKINLTAAMADVKILRYSIQKNDLISLTRCLHNDLEQAARVKDNTIIKIKELLMSCGAKAVLMSGSGSTVFGVVLSRKEAVGLKRRLDRLKACPGGQARGDWQVFLARTY